MKKWVLSGIGLVVLVGLGYVGFKYYLAKKNGKTKEQIKDELKLFGQEILAKMKLRATEGGQ
jgi:uncharacterized membrane-anchored protein YhcB (DUF1043 family)